jgi:dTDP-4-amino-4,6-dideoxygalactose transaminase
MFPAYDRGLMPNVPLLDLRAQHQKLKAELMQAFEQAIDSGRFIMGPEVENLEKEVAQYCQARYAIGCASGSDALLLALMAYGIGPGDEVITSPYTFFATASCIARVGAKAVFADICPHCFNLDPRDVLKKMSGKTRAIIPVHLFGQSADMEPWLQEARKREIRIIEDAAQAIGSRYHGKPVGAIGDVGCLSFFPTKNLGALGDAGMLLTNDAGLAEKLRVLRVHGAKVEYDHQWLGVNSRIDALQAAFLRIKLRHLDEWAEARRRNAAIYTRLLVKTGLADPTSQRQGCGDNATVYASGKPLFLPAVCQEGHVYNQFVIQVRDPKTRDPFRKHLESQGISVRVYYPISLHLQKCFSHWGYRNGDLPNSEHANRVTLALPIFPELTEPQQQQAVDAMKAFNWKAS